MTRDEKCLAIRREDRVMLMTRSCQQLQLWMCLMHLKAGDRVRLTDDVISSYYDRGEIYIEETKGSIAVILSPDEFLLDETYKQIYSRAQITEFMLAGERYPIRCEKKAPMAMSRDSGFEIMDRSREGRVDLVSKHVLEKLQDNFS